MNLSVKSLSRTVVPQQDMSQAIVIASHLFGALQFNSMSRRLRFGQNFSLHLFFVRPEATSAEATTDPLIYIDCVEFSRLSGYCAAFFCRAIAFLLYAICEYIVRVRAHSSTKCERENVRLTQHTLTSFRTGVYCIHFRIRL